MFSANFMIAVVLFAISTSFTPGPNNFLLIASGIKFGIKRTWGHIFGIAIGFPIMVFIVGFAFSNIITLNTTIFNILSILGIMYMLRLAYQIIFSDIRYEESDSKAKPITFLQASLFQWINPKAWVMAFSIASSYISFEYNFYTQLFFIAFVFFIISILSSISWTLFGSVIKKILTKSKYIKSVNIFLGILLIISIIQMLPQKFF